jgi:energy-converting hydrogenase Eha subunit F
VNLDEILYGGDGIEDDLDSILLNPVASTIPKWRTFKLLRWAIILNRLVYLDEILYGDYGIESDLESILLNTVASTIPEWRTFNLLRWARL